MQFFQGSSSWEWLSKITPERVVAELIASASESSGYYETRTPPVSISVGRLAGQGLIDIKGRTCRAGPRGKRSLFRIAGPDSSGSNQRKDDLQNQDHRHQCGKTAQEPKQDYAKALFDDPLTSPSHHTGRY
jgi:hypothetical protein